MPMKKSRFHKAIETRRIYKFEGECFHGSYYSKQRRIKYLRSEAIYIWRKMKFKEEMPKLTAGKGVLNNGFWYSYYSIDDGIVLSRSQRNIITLVHEIVHHLGYDEHDHKFLKQYFNILKRCYKFTDGQITMMRYIWKLP